MASVENPKEMQSGWTVAVVAVLAFLSGAGVVWVAERTISPNYLSMMGYPRCSITRLAGFHMGEFNYQMPMMDGYRLPNRLPMMRYYGQR